MKTKMPSRAALMLLAIVLTTSCNKEPDDEIKMQPPTASKTASSGDHSRDVDTAADANIPSSRSDAADSFNYSSATESQLRDRSNGRDGRATGELAVREILTKGNAEGAKDLLLKAAYQGSEQAAGQLAALYDPDSSVRAEFKSRFKRELPSNAAEAYIWTRVSELQGDRDARTGILQLSKGMTRSKQLELEILAIEQYQQINANYKALTGKELEFPQRPYHPDEMRTVLESMRSKERN